MLTKEVEKDLQIFLGHYPLPSSDENQKLIEKIKKHFSSLCNHKLLQAIASIPPDIIGMMLGISQATIKRWVNSPLNLSSQGSLEMMIFAILLSSIIEDEKKQFSDYQI